jgi:hypothetical protein
MNYFMYTIVIDLSANILYMIALLYIYIYIYILGDVYERPAMSSQPDISITDSVIDKDDFIIGNTILYAYILYNCYHFY